jgi:acyl-CoA reductase-like NAD-dependent aldehyde dehydrogenase
MRKALVTVGKPAGSLVEIAIWMCAAALAAGIVTVALKPAADGPTVIVLAAVVLVVSTPVVPGAAVGATSGVVEEL